MALLRRIFDFRESPASIAQDGAHHFAFGRSRVLTPVPPDQVWVFFRSFPTPSHRGMPHITDKANAGSSINFLVPTTFFPTILTVPIPNLLVNVAAMAVESLSSPPPFGLRGGNEDENHKPVRFIDFEFYSDCTSRLNKSPPQSIHMQVVTLSQGPLNPVPQNGPPPAKSGGGVAASTRP
ncbi:hypothetical protein GEV33_010695 [Tenebrio molitor]|uniref:Uncharacterized protein n=1 Tax=Tenebrio molitor TaxID=7067 RepID=A0A8J6HCT3_TENMO|nr:hypothetical protein GEV33_010695 [Tenebrio molitor]